MARAVVEWQGRTDDTPIPDRVKSRISARQGDCCACCFLAFGPLRPPRFDHRPALINGGQNRESMIQAVCIPCHAMLTMGDVAEKSKVARIRSKHLGIRARKGPPMPGSRGSRWKRTMDGRTVER